MSNLIDSIKTVIKNDGDEISFTKKNDKLEICIIKCIGEKTFAYKHLIPIQDHNYKNKVVDCIIYIETLLDKKINNNL